MTTTYPPAIDRFSADERRVLVQMLARIALRVVLHDDRAPDQRNDAERPMRDGNRGRAA